MTAPITDRKTNRPNNGSLPWIPTPGDLPLAQRLDRIEQALLTIDKDKLDADAATILTNKEVERLLSTKANQSDLKRLEHTIQESQAGNTPQARMFLQRFDHMEADISDVVRHGSAQAQEAAVEIAALTKRVETLHEESVRTNALGQQRVSESLARNRFWVTTVSILNAVTLLANIILAAVLHLH